MMIEGSKRLGCVGSRPDTGSAPERAGEEGVIGIAAALALATFIGLFVVMVLEQGTLFAGRTQLQHAADAGARGALMRASFLAIQEGASETELRREAREMAFAAIKGGTILNTAPTRQDFTIELGTYVKGVFNPLETLQGPPQAARVTATPVGGFGAPFSPRTLRSSATAIATYPCRNVVIAADVSLSLRDDELVVKRGIKRAIDGIFGSAADGAGQFGIVGFAGEDLASDSLTAGGVSSVYDLDPADLVGESGRAKRFVDDLRFCDPDNPDCFGTHLQSGLEQAGALFDRMEDTCVEMLILLTDGVPCRAFVPNVGIRGSSAEESRDEALRISAEGASIAPIFLNSAGEADEFSCDGVTQNEPYLSSLASGYGTLLTAGFAIDEIANNIQEALIKVPPVLVE